VTQLCVGQFKDILQATQWADINIVKICVLCLQEEVTNHLERGEAPACVGSGALSGKWLRLDKHTDNSDKMEGGSLLEAEGTEPIFLNVPASLSMHREEKTLKNSDAMGKAKVEVGKNWTMLEMGLYKKGVQIFGKNRYTNWETFTFQIFVRGKIDRGTDVQMYSVLNIGNAAV
jgi:hypothetical protein